MAKKLGYLNSVSLSARNYHIIYTIKYLNQLVIIFY